MMKDLDFRDKQGNIIKAKAFNISNDGLLIKSTTPMKAGTQFSLKFEDDDRKSSISMEALCGVVRVTNQSGGYAVGLIFLNKFVTKTPRKVFKLAEQKPWKITHGSKMMI
jgi:hypothetical protein